MSEAARRTIPGLRASGVAASDEVGRDIRGSTTILELLRMFPDGRGADAINNNCLACHSAGMVLNQPAMSREAWTSEVKKMINNYKAPIAPEDVGTIVDYLVAFKSAE